MEELERERTRQNHGKIIRDPEKVHALESLRLARTELDRQLVATTHERRRAQLDSGDRRSRSADEGNRSHDEVSGSGVSAPVHAYHDGTKHHFHRFARSLGYLDWASQPNPFRSFAGAPDVFRCLRGRTRCHRVDASIRAVGGDVLRHALGLSAWKQFGASRWSLRVNPSSGNLHPDRGVRDRRTGAGPWRRARRLSLRARSPRARAALRRSTAAHGRRRSRRRTSGWSR